MNVLYGALVALAAISLITTFPKVGMSAIAVSIVSFFLGFATKAGYLRVQGQQVRVPIIERSRVTFSMLVIIMLSLSLVSIFQVQRVIDSSEDCNRQFRTALTYNAGINREDNDLRDERDAQLSKRRDAQDKLIRTLGPSGVVNDAALRQYQSVVDSVEDQLQRIDARRMEAQRTRAPYPVPTCGTQ
ncbi:hypothetical protein [Williamsia serinedens]|uniref:hypothetical protein n=1 Tax=Williamsia serinedens TaxID=391736 RepID=UPI0031E45505